MHILNAHTVSRNKLLGISGRKFMVFYNISSQYARSYILVDFIWAARYSTVFGPLNKQNLQSIINTSSIIIVDNIKWSVMHAETNDERI
jgi:hypothetical protein